MRVSGRGFVLLALLAAGTASEARAAGFYIADVGARAIARGGAFVAAPDSPLALHYNPAGLSLMRGLHFEISASVVALTATFERKCPCVDPSLVDRAEAARLDAELEASFAGNRARTSTPLVIPFVGIAYGFEPWNATVGFAVYGPNSGRHNYGALGSAGSPEFEARARALVTRYNVVEAPNTEINYVLGGSIEPIDGVRIGIGLFLHQTGARQSLHLFADTAFADGPEDPGWDVPITLDFLSDPSFTFNAGVSLDVPFVPGLSLGASFRPSRDVEAEGSIDVDLPASLQGLARVEGEDVAVRLRTAPLVRAGAQYRLPDLLTAELAFVWEGWSVYDRVVIDPENIEFRLEVGNPVVLEEIVAERNWRDTWSLRLGGELEIYRPWVGVQAGYFYEPSAIPTEWLEPSRIDLDKHAFAVGVTSEWRGISLVLSMMYVTLGRVEVRNSRARMTAPIGFAPELRTTVGNGIYDGEYLIGSASLRFSLDTFLSAS